MARLLLVGIACAAVGCSLAGRTRIWLHTTGSLHIWYHLGLFGLLGALALRAASRSAWRVTGLTAVVLFGFAIEISQSMGNHAAIEWADVQIDCFGVAFGCLAFWLLSGRPQPSA